MQLPWKSKVGTFCYFVVVTSCGREAAEADDWGVSAKAGAHWLPRFRICSLSGFLVPRLPCPSQLLHPYHFHVRFVNRCGFT